MSRSSRSSLYALVVIVVLIVSVIFGFMILQSIVNTTDPSSVAETNLSGVNETTNTVLTALFNGSMLPVWVLIIAAVCLALYMMVRAAKRG